MIASGLRVVSWARKSSLDLILSGWVIGRAKRNVDCLTGDATSSRPRPLGRSGWVTTRWILCPAAASFSRVGTANCGVPQKTRLRDEDIEWYTRDPSLRL